MYQLDGEDGSCCEFLHNCSDEERYKLLSSKAGILKLGILETLNDTLFDPDLAQYLYGLNFVRKDSSKLSSQKRQILHQVRNDFKVDYESEQFKKVLQKIKK